MQNRLTDRVFVIKKLDHPPGWSLVATNDAKVGCVWDEWLMVGPPEHNAFLRRIVKGKSAVGIAERYFKGAMEWDKNHRFYVNVLVYVNRGEGHK